MLSTYIDTVYVKLYCNIGLIISKFLICFAAWSVQLKGIGGVFEDYIRVNKISNKVNFLFCLLIYTHTKKNQLIKIHLCQQFFFYRNITTPCLSYAHCTMPQSKTGLKKLHTLMKTSELCQSISAY